MNSDQFRSSLLPDDELRRFSVAAKFTVISLFLIACVAILSIGFIPVARPISFNREFAPPLKKLTNPVVIMISTGGFAFDYKSNENYTFPSILSLINDGTEAKNGLIPVFPTKTVPNHYSIVTGLYPEDHGIINDEFPNPENPNREQEEWFTPDSKGPRWWLGEPLWVTLTKHNLRAMTYFWPGADIKKEPWTCSLPDCKGFDKDIPVSFEDMVSDVLAYFESCDDICDENIPSLFTVYFNQPELAGSNYGLDSGEIRRNISIVDKAIGMLIEGLIDKQVYNEVNIIIVSDHGMVNRDDKNMGLSLENILESTDTKKLPQDWVSIEAFLPLLAIQTPKNTSEKMVEETVRLMNVALKNHSVMNAHKVTFLAKEDLPKRLHYNKSDRIPAIIGLVDIGYAARVKQYVKMDDIGGTAGYDNAFKEMRGMFVGHGPRFRKGFKVESFENIQIYNLVMEILGIKGADNAGSRSFKDSFLLPLSSAQAPAPAPAASFCCNNN